MFFLDTRYKTPTAAINPNKIFEVSITPNFSVKRKNMKNNIEKKPIYNNSILFFKILE